MQADIGLIGLAVMGQNLVLNMADHGYQVAVFNRTVTKVDDFLKAGAKGKSVVGTHSLKEFVAALKRPRRVLIMVKAGEAVDELIEELLPFLEAGDILIDGGNSYFGDTERRVEDLKKRSILFMGMGISGGEEGARHGPSMMPGGNPDAWPQVKKIFQAISAKASDGAPRCDWVGSGGAGHYVKMVHNGIEYGDMQLIAEVYDLLKRGMQSSYPDMAALFTRWNRGSLNSYLIEITAKVLQTKDQDGKPLMEKVLDAAGQKGTGKWTGMQALDLGVPVTLIGEAVFARCLSALKEERVEASRHYPSAPSAKSHFDEDEMARALYASKIVSYAQGFMLMRQASDLHKWDLNYGAIALLWRGGCIIRSQFLDRIADAYKRNPKLLNLLLDPFFQKEVAASVDGWRKLVVEGVKKGIPLPCLSTALAFFDGYRSSVLPANLIQALRDCFGAHLYERIDQPRGKTFHTEW